MKIPFFPNFIDFYEVDVTEYKSYIKDFEPYSDFNYVSLYSWNQSGTCYVSQLNGNIILSLKNYTDDTSVLTFIGKNEVLDTALQLVDYARESPIHKNELTLIPHDVAEELRKASINLAIDEDHDNHDYVLSAKEYLTLSGKAFQNKRKNTNKFLRLYGDNMNVMVTDLYNESLRLQIKELVQTWQSWGTEGAQNPENESRAINALLDSYDSLNNDHKLYTSCLYINDNLEGFCVFEILDDYAITHFGKANIAYNKAYEYLMVFTLQSIHQKFQVDLVNNEQDLGISGLRHAKLAQNPYKFLKKYKVTLI